MEEMQQKNKLVKDFQDIKSSNADLKSDRIIR